MLTIIAVIVALINLIRERDFEAVLYGGVGIFLAAGIECIVLLMVKAIYTLIILFQGAEVIICGL